ncbi:MAG: 23S rRNA pseudouridine(1911/1915/1917) synthase RluD [Gammaproteobacteria bacterium]|nr:23S rRNA pseudouridine(1911/1915/1917) synthase RluD [Gammaproteobacteria bacterium]
MKNDSKKNLNLIIPDTYAHMRLDQALAKLLPDYSRTQIQEWIEMGSILVNGMPMKAKTKLKGGETVSIDVIEKPQPTWEAQAIPLTIVYEDDALLVINKPPGLVVHPGAGNANHTLLNALLYHAADLQLLPRAGILHRLDKDTSGLLVIAKTAASLKDLSQQLKKRTLVREYQAIIYGQLISGGRIDAPIDRHPLQRKRMAVVETGKPAVTHYRIMEKYRAHTRLKVRLETGRTHQIRVHLSHIHHPLVGDITYGGRVQLTKGMSSELIQSLRHFKRQALHACALGFSHPVTNEWMQFEIDLPEDMTQLIAELRKDAKENP